MFLVSKQSCSNVLRAAEERHVAGAAFLVLVAGLFLGSVQPAEAAGVKLSKGHKKWLEEEVIYIISDEEKRLFLDLPSNTERDKFIDRFWALRDPTPGTPKDEYKEEHYRRIDYANTFGRCLLSRSTWRSSSP